MDTIPGKLHLSPILETNFRRIGILLLSLMATVLTGNFLGFPSAPPGKRRDNTSIQATRTSLRVSPTYFSLLIPPFDGVIILPLKLPFNMVETR
jgi:hypothetical protein